MREFLIGKDDGNQRVDKFIVKTLTTMPKSLMYKYIRNKKIKVNHKRCEISQRLVEGDTMQCYIAEEFFEQKHATDFLKVSSKLDVLYEDEQIIIMNKPSGLLVHSDTSEIQDTLAGRFLHYLYKKKEYDPSLAQSFTPALCHRLDRNTQGIVIGAKTADALRKINEKIRDGEVEKKYICIVEGVFDQKKDHLILWHKKMDGNKVDISDVERSDYQRIETKYRVLAEKQTHSLVEIDLLTGKSHQIRGVMAHIHHPLYGDVKYGAKKNQRSDYQALCAYKIKFAFKDNNGVVEHLKGKSFELREVDVQTVFDNLNT